MKFTYKKNDYSSIDCYTGTDLVCYISPSERFLVWHTSGNLGAALRCFNIRKMPAEVSMLKIITSLVLL